MTTAASEVPGRHRRRPMIVIAALPTGWLVLTAAYLMVLPVFGVLSPVTWLLSWAGWLWVLAVPVAAAGGYARRQAIRPAIALSLLAVLAGAALWLVGPPQRTPADQFRRHRHDLARLAAEYRAGALGGDTALPWRLRFLSVDGRAHRRCGTTDPGTGHRQCALFLLLWRDWRAEDGSGFGYYPTPPGPDASIGTADGDVGRPIRELGAGWWWVG